MITIECKVYGTVQQYSRVDEAIRTVQFIRNKCLRLWMDHQDSETGIGRNELARYTADLAQSHGFVRHLNSSARQASAERTWTAISRFYQSRKSHSPNQYPRFQNDNRSVEYRKSGWKLEARHARITFTDRCGIGTLKLRGGHDLTLLQPDHIKRVRLLKRADGYYLQLLVKRDPTQSLPSAHQQVGLDVGLRHFLVDSEGQAVPNPRHHKRSLVRLKRKQRQLARKKKGSQNRKKAAQKLSRLHLKTSRQRKDFVVKTARCVVKSNDLIAVEQLQVRNLLKNRRLTRSIQDAGWRQFIQWLSHFARKMGRTVVFVPPEHTTSLCSHCGALVPKSLRERVHRCSCGLVMDRDHNAARNILKFALHTVGHTEIQA